MKLTTLEIKGFKSFAEKTSIEFQDGVTAIVGPNGCGKSNIVDAIRWVLGEQSTRSLRSEKMENIIFNGTSKRKPSNLAEVSLSFDNSGKLLPTEYSQITLTRKLFRSGESEYRLNDIPCRLKDITDLFLDTGIGSDSYSIIELKMVEELISNKEGSRRTLFEEAAGIAKYRLRKKQTYSKLKDTEEDLDRVEDVLFEIGKNLKSLEQQARKTEKYYKLRDQYRESILQISTQKILAKKREWVEFEKVENAIEDEILFQKTQSELIIANVEKKRLELLHAEKQVGVQQKVLNDFKADIQAKENDVRFKNEKIKNLSDAREKLEADSELDQNQREVLEKKIAELDLLFIPEQEKLLNLEQNLPSIIEELNSIDLQQKAQKIDLDLLKTQIRQEKDKAYQLEKELDKISIQIESTTGDLGRILQEFELANGSSAQFELLLHENLNLFSQNQAIVETKKSRETKINHSLQDLEMGLEKMREEIAIQSRTLDSQQNEYNLTKSLVDSLEGFPDSIIFLKNKAEWLKNTPLLSDIILCEEEYRVAIELYLQSYMNYFVVESRTDAQKAIELLGSSSKGRSHFFILEEFKNMVENLDAHSSFSTLLGLNADLIPALQVIKVEPQYEKLVRFLLSKILIGSHFENFLSYPQHKDWVFLEKRGLFYSNRIEISGGSIGLFEGKRIGRVLNLEVLQNSIQSLRGRISKMNQEKTHLQSQLQVQKMELEELKVSEAILELNKNESRRNTLIHQKEDLETKKRLLLARKEELNIFTLSLWEKKKSLQPQIDLATIQISKMELDLSKRELDLEKTLIQNTELSSHFNTVNLEFHQSKNRLEGIQKESEYHKNQLEGNLARGFRRKEQFQQIELELFKLREDETDPNLDFNGLYAQMEKIEEGLLEMEENYAELKNEIQEIEKKDQDLRKKKDILQNQLVEIKEKKTVSGFEMRSISERVFLEFSVDPMLWQETINRELEEISFEPEALVQKEEQALKIKNQMDGYGPINPLAMEAYNEMNARHQFIGSQKEDLMLAKASLMETIQEIDHTATKKFMEAFTAVRENFIKVFRTLFNEEDSCDLILMQPENPLESEIEILARPKGKRPLTINQLSGGEKTLTATAILFSLYLLKPAPFCIFDEVDAPLDDTNIEKFNSIIRQFSDKSQFIVVSHNKKTISSTDIIYGVTMAEMGISKVVAIDLRKSETAA